MKVMRRSAFAALAIATALTLSACGSDEEMATEEVAAETMSPGTIVDVAIAAGNFNTLVAAVTAAELVETLSGTGPFTVFAPTDEAFAALPAGVLDALLLPENKALLAQILTYHVVPGQLNPSQVVGTQPTSEGATLTVTGTGDHLQVNGANVICGGIPTANATLYLIDTVLLPPAN